MRTRIEANSPPGRMPDLVAGFDAENAPRTGEESPRQQFTIRDLTREFDVTARTLRFYEEKGLLEPLRAGQDRLYSRRDRARLKYILMGKGVGFSLEEIRDMLDLYDLGDGQATQLKVAQERFYQQIERLKRQRDDIDRALAELERAHTAVAEMLAARADRDPVED